MSESDVHKMEPPADGYGEDSFDVPDSLLQFMQTEMPQTAPRKVTESPILPIVLHQRETERGKILGELEHWLAWFLKAYDVETVEFPYQCWYKHPYVVEECLALWTAWRVMHKPQAHPSDPLTFNERVLGWRQRMAERYHSKCKDGHQDDRPQAKLAQAATN